MKFANFGLQPKILQALEEKGYDTPTEIQQKTLEAFRAWKHILWQSQTGSGKTAAFVLPLLDAIDTQKREPQVIILAPTRELAVQIRDEVFELSKHLYMRSLSCFGGISKRRQIEELRKWPQIIVGTPWRVMDLIEWRFIKLQSIKYFVLDEVDRMLDMWFIDTIEDIWNRLDTIDQALTFSATLPDEVLWLIKQFIWDQYEHIQVSQTVVVDTVDHMFMQVPNHDKYEVLQALLQGNPSMKTLIFTETKMWADDLAYRLDGDGYKVDALHGDMDQRDRFRTLRRIKENEVDILVATDVAARWLNMNKVDLVINYQVPNDPESYVHRIWRTARAGLSWNAIMFVDRNEFRKLHAIERVSKVKIKQINTAGEEVERTDKPQRWKRKWWWGRNQKYRFSRSWWWQRSDRRWFRERSARSSSKTGSRFDKSERPVRAERWARPVRNERPEKAPWSSRFRARWSWSDSRPARGWSSRGWYAWRSGGRHSSSWTR